MPTPTELQMGDVTLRAEDGPFKLRRHGGRRTDTWREVWSGPSVQTARTQFVNTRGCLRQGGVELLAADGRRLAHAWGPRLRTRW